MLPAFEGRATNDLSIDTLRHKSLIGRAVQRARNAVSLVKLQYYNLSASSTRHAHPFLSVSQRHIPAFEALLRELHTGPAS